METQVAATETEAPGDPGPLLTPAEVAQIFRVDVKTVTRWSKAGRLSSIRTLGDHRRYFAAEVYSLIRLDPRREDA